MNGKSLVIIWIAVGLLIIVGFGCRKKPQSDSPIIASVGNVTLSVNELNETLPSHQGLEISVVQIQNYLQRWTEKELVYQEALTSGFLQNPDIQRKLRDHERDYVYALYVINQIDERLNISDDELVEYYEEHPDEFIRPENLYDVQLILVATLAEANAVIRSVNSGQDFGTVAQEKSLDESKNNDGRVGWTNLTGFPEEVRRRVFSLAVGQVSQPIQTAVGFYVVRLLGSRPRGERQQLDEVRGVVTWKIKSYKREAEYKEWLNQLRTKTNVSINWGLYDSLDIK